MFVSRIMAVAAAVAAITPAAVYAAPTSDDTAITRQVNVRTADLDLASAAGQRALQSRVRSATTQVCGDAVQTGHITESPAVTRCKQAALVGAKQQVADLIALHTTQFAQATPARTTVNTASGS